MIVNSQRLISPFLFLLFFISTHTIKSTMSVASIIVWNSSKGTHSHNNYYACSLSMIHSMTKYTDQQKKSISKSSPIILEMPVNKQGWNKHDHFHPDTETCINTVQILCIGTDRSQQTVQTKIRLLLKKQSDQGLRCLPFHQHLLDALMQCYIKLFYF